MLTLALLLTSQSFASAHAFEYGPEPHQHHGAVCLAIVNDPDDSPLPADHSVFARFVPYTTESCALASRVPGQKSATLQPPATGPPAV